MKEVDGQMFFVKQDRRSYCLLGKDKDGNAIETIVKDDECVITDEICSILLDEGTTYLIDNPKFLKLCK